MEYRSIEKEARWEKECEKRDFAKFLMFPELYDPAGISRYGNVLKLSASLPYILTVAEGGSLLFRISPFLFHNYDVASSYRTNIEIFSYTASSFVYSSRVGATQTFSNSKLSPYSTTGGRARPLTAVVTISFGSTTSTSAIIHPHQVTAQQVVVFKSAERGFQPTNAGIVTSILSTSIPLGSVTGSGVGNVRAVIQPIVDATDEEWLLLGTDNSADSQSCINFLYRNLPILTSCRFWVNVEVYFEYIERNSVPATTSILGGYRLYEDVGIIGTGRLEKPIKLEEMSRYMVEVGKDYVVFEGEYAMRSEYISNKIDKIYKEFKYAGKKNKESKHKKGSKGKAKKQNKKQDKKSSKQKEDSKASSGEERTVEYAS